jgi:hypothetical protein
MTIYFRMPNYFCSIEEREFESLLSVSNREYPMLVAFAFKVFGFNPMVTFVVVTALSPFPQ